jgi:Flp pilus assembly protein TadD
MKSKTIIAAALFATASVAGGIAATAASDTGALRRAAAQASDAEKLLKKHKADKAIDAAEKAVALDPRNAGYRTLLGQAYLAAGRFQSAAAALGDAVALDPADGQAALHLALAQIATGDWGAARNTLALHEGSIPASDRGLAIALAGDPAGAVAILTNAARVPGADAKTRQNLALSLALAGRWNEAKAIASLDMSPADVDQRIMQWAAFAQPTGSADQVAALLGVVPVADGGQPQQLALRVTSPNVAAVAQAVDPVDAYMPGPGAAPVEAVATKTEATPDVGTVSPMVAKVAFAPRREIVQAIPEVAPRVENIDRVAAVKPAVRTAAVAPAAPIFAKGGYFVQLGAFDSAGVAKDAWSRLSRRHRALAAMSPSGAQISSGGATYYRLSVGGFARGSADSLCRSVRAAGGRCFVRASAGDAVASWSRRGGGVEMAAR